MFNTLYRCSRTIARHGWSLLQRLEYSSTRSTPLHSRLEQQPIDVSHVTRFLQALHSQPHQSRLFNTCCNASVRA
jgi:hypothetical protein